MNWIDEPIFATLCAACIAAATSIFSLLFNYFSNRRAARFRLQLEKNTVDIRHFIAVTNEQISKEFNDIKKQELNLTTRWQFASILLQRYGGLHDSIAELLTILDQHFDSGKRASDETLERFRLAKNKVALYFSPKGEFAEEYNVQMSQIEVSLMTGKKFSDTYSTHFGSVFHMNSWSLADAEFFRIQELIKPEIYIKLELPKPHRAKFK